MPYITVIIHFYKFRFTMEAKYFIIFQLPACFICHIFFSYNTRLNIFIRILSMLIKIFLFQAFIYLFRAYSISSSDLFLHITRPPLSCVHLRTNSLGKLSKSISSKLSQTPNVGIMYSSPMISATIFLPHIYPPFGYNPDACNLI